MTDATKLDKIDKNDPELEMKTAALLKQRMEDEKRKAELRQEQKMQKAREEIKIKKDALSTETKTSSPILTQPEVIPNIKVPSAPATPSNKTLDETPEYITLSEFNATKAKINQSFAWLEQYIKEQEAKNTRFENFVTALTKAIDQFKK